MDVNGATFDVILPGLQPGARVRIVCIAGNRQDKPNLDPPDPVGTRRARYRAVSAGLTLSLVEGRGTLDYLRSGDPNTA